MYLPAARAVIKTVYFFLIKQRSLKQFKFLKSVDDPHTPVLGS